MRTQHPTTRIYISKFDLDAVYRRIHSHPKSAVKAVTMVNQTAYILNRLPFGAAAEPSIYSTISEMIFDLAQDIADDSTFDFKKTTLPTFS